MFHQRVYQRELLKKHLTMNFVNKASSTNSRGLSRIAATLSRATVLTHFFTPVYKKEFILYQDYHIIFYTNVGRL